LQACMLIMNDKYLQIGEATIEQYNNIAIEQ